MQHFDLEEQIRTAGSAPRHRLDWLPHHSPYASSCPSDPLIPGPREVVDGGNNTHQSQPPGPSRRQHRVRVAICAVLRVWRLRSSPRPSSPCGLFCWGCRPPGALAVGGGHYGRGCHSRRALRRGHGRLGRLLGVREAPWMPLCRGQRDPGSGDPWRYSNVGTELRCSSGVLSWSLAGGVGRRGGFPVQAGLIVVLVVVVMCVDFFGL